MTTEYTRKEREAINSAWSWLEHLAAREDRSGVLESVYKYERRGRSNTHCAKAVMLRCVQSGYESPRTPIHNIVGISWGCQWATIFGANIRESMSKGLRFPGDYVHAANKLILSIEHAIAAEDTHTKRLVESI